MNQLAGKMNLRALAVKGVYSEKSHGRSCQPDSYAVPLLISNTSYPTKDQYVNMYLHKTFAVQWNNSRIELY